eukprot:3941375-Rhodomonas_salina.2
MRTQSLVLLGVIATLITPSSGASNGTGTCARVQAGDSTAGLLDAVTSYRNTLGYAGLDSIDARKAEVVSCIPHPFYRSSVMLGADTGHPATRKQRGKLAR